MKIAILGLNYAPEPIGIGPYTSGLAEFLARRGHDVTVVAGNPYYPDWRLAPGFDKHGSRSVENGVTVVRVSHFIPARPRAASRMAHYLSFARSARRAMTKLDRQDLVLAIAPSLVAAPVALGFARKWGAASWLHIQDFEVEAAVATGLLSSGMLARMGSAFERRVIAGFDHVSSISRPMVAKAIEKGAAPQRAIELRNWADTDLAARAEEVEQLRRKLAIPDGPIALYSGNLALKQGAHIIGEAARLTAGRSDVQWVVCGEGTAREALEADAEGTTNLHIRPLVERRDLGALLAMADIHVLTQIAGAADLVLPSKLTNMLASGRPVVATADPATALGEEVAPCGILAEPGDAASLAMAVERLASDEGLRVRLGKKAGELARERWSAPVLLERFAIALEQAASEHGGP
ncbi:WcaI family glycosyltransferase [Erythrobacter sp. HKB08]|uniref:WcaI family glycosyltransferase n=1 Tax=Erythrobacter sp. HKB08 TaxID=2502843 RepID=UPI001008B17B|nr:WcaI family glycosyltransferase [Erythrobacter sp. HKB08]